MAQDIAVFKDKRLQKFLKGMQRHQNKIEKRHRDYAVLISSIVFKDVINHFEQEKGPKNKWSSWSPGYASFLQRVGKGGNQILQDSGKLRQSFQPANWRKAQGGIVWFNKAKTKSGFPYAAHHDEGKSDGSGPRSYMWLSDKALKSVGVKTLRFITEGK